MTENEKRALDQLDIRKIDSDGKYVDITVPIFYNLNYEQVMYLREKYCNNTIAMNVKRKSDVVPRQEEVARRNRDSMSRTHGTSRYNVTRDQRYNNGRYRTKKRINYFPVGKIIVGALVISIAAGIIVPRVLDRGSNVEYDDSIAVVAPIESKNIGDPAGSSYAVNEEALEINQDGQEVMEDSSMGGENLEEVVEEAPVEEINGDLVRELCDIYHVNYDVVYPFLRDLTNNFSSEQYMSGCLDGVTCKGIPVQANSERELMIYTIRCIKQLPNQMGISVDNLYGNTTYDSGHDYLQMISKVSSDLGVDRCLMYAITQSETNFESELFQNSNNPAGIRLDGEWWAFDTKEEGFYELGMEMLKYYRMIGASPSEVNSSIIEQIRDIHAPLSDGNEHWLPNVLENYEYAVMNESTLFGSQGVNLSY